MKKHARREARKCALFLLYARGCWKSGAFARSSLALYSTLDKAVITVKVTALHFLDPLVEASFALIFGLSLIENSGQLFTESISLMQARGVQK